MAGQVVNLLVLMAIGVMIADLVANSEGTKALFGGFSNIWKIGVNGMLGKPSQ